jgi:hypothetical protein
MAGTFEGLSDLEWQLFADLFPPEPRKRGRGIPYPLSPGREHVAVRPDHRLPLMRHPVRATMGLQERRPSVAAALADVISHIVTATTGASSVSAA